MALRNLHKSKMSYTKESILNTDGDFNLKSSMGNDAFMTDNEAKKKKKNKSSLTIKHKNINNPDFINVFDSNGHQ